MAKSYPVEKSLYDDTLRYYWSIHTYTTPLDEFVEIVILFLWLNCNSTIYYDIHNISEKILHIFN